MNNQSKLVLSPEHDQPLGTWSSEQIRQSVNDSVMLTWAPGKARYVCFIIYVSFFYFSNYIVYKSHVIFVLIKKGTIYPL